MPMRTTPEAWLPDLPCQPAALVPHPGSTRNCSYQEISQNSLCPQILPASGSSKPVLPATSLTLTLPAHSLSQ
jgi:hypothetical protein